MRDRGALGMEEQVVLGEEAGEQHPVPLLVGDLLDQHRRCPAMRTPPPRALARSRSAVRRPRSSGDRPAGDSALLDAQAGEGGTGRRLGEAAGGDDRLLEVAAELGGEGWHRVR